MHSFSHALLLFVILTPCYPTAFAQIPPPRMTAIISVPFGGGGDDHNVQWMQRGGYWSEVEHHYERVTQQQVEMIAAAGFTPVLVLQASEGTRQRQAQDHGVPPPGNYLGSRTVTLIYQRQAHPPPPSPHLPDLPSIVNTEIAAVGGNASKTSWKVT